MLGLSKSFVIFLFVAVLFAIGMGNWRYGAAIMIGYAIIKAIWKFLTN